MNRSLPAIILLILFFAAQANCQKYTEGTIDFGLIEVKNISNPNLDSSQLEQLRATLKDNIDMKLYFTKNRMASIDTGVFGKIIREVFDTETNKKYTFKEVGGKPAFLLDEIVDNQDLIASQLAGIDFGTGTALNERQFGLTCTLYEKEIAGSQISLTITKDLYVNNFSTPPGSSIPEGTVVSLSMKDPTGMFIKMGIKSFSPKEQDPGLFAIDTIGLTNKTKLRDAVITLYSEQEKESQKIKKHFGKYESQGFNNELIRSLASDGLVDSTDWNISRILANQIDCDIPSIFLLLDPKNSEIHKTRKDSLRNVFIKNNILSLSIDSLLSDASETWENLSDRMRYDALWLASVKDLLDDSEVRKMIVKNLDRMGYANFSNSETANAFIDGNSNLESLVGEIDGFTRLPQTQALSDEEIHVHIKNFYDLTLATINPEYKLVIKGDKFTIIDDQNTYDMSINHLKSLDYKRSDYSQDPPVEVYNDTTLVDYSFYKNLIIIVKQMGADHEDGMTYNIYELQPPFSLSAFQMDYDHIVDSHPELEIDIDALYFQRIPNRGYDNSTLAGASFDFHPHSEGEEFAIGNFNKHTYPPKGYIPSKKKKLFIQFLEQFHNDFQISDKKLKDIINLIGIRLFDESEKLLQYIPTAKFTISKKVNKRSYSPKFTDYRNDFKHAYPSIFEVIGVDFDAKNFIYNEEEKKIHFEWNGETYSIEIGDKAMVDFLMEHLNATESGKRLYPVNDFSYSKDLYFYLTPDQKAMLGKILSLKF